MSPLDLSQNHSLSVTISQTIAPVGSSNESWEDKELLTDLSVKFNWLMWDDELLYSVQCSRLSNKCKHQQYERDITDPLNGLTTRDMTTSVLTSSVPLYTNEIPSGYNLKTLHILTFPWEVRPTIYSVCAIQS